jgi:hypothetical protein
LSRKRLRRKGGVFIGGFTGKSNFLNDTVAAIKDRHIRINVPLRARQLTLLCPEQCYLLIAAKNG